MKGMLMGIPPISWVLISLIVSVFSPTQGNSQAILGETERSWEQATFRAPWPLAPGRTEGTGAYFEIRDSRYLNITLKSSEDIKVILESIPKMISLDIQAATNASSTTVTIEGLDPNKIYYKYQDSYKNGGSLASDENGILTWTQDLSQPHHIWLQGIKGTISLPERENKYGFWDESTRTYTLNQDMTESVEIVESNFTFDGNGYTISGKETGYGIYLSWEKANNVTIKNTVIKNFSTGILLWFSWGTRIEGNLISNNKGDGLHLVSSSEIVLNNEINFNQSSGIYYYARGGETISGMIQDNNISNNGFGMYLHNQGGAFGGTSIIDNILNLNNYGLVLRGTYSYDFSSNNEIKDNYISNNNLGVYLAETTKENKIYHNNFLNNNTQISNEGLNNLFDNGYPSGGNYWSDYSGFDANGDGIGDTPYVFTGGQDRYPFMTESGWQAPPEWSFAIITDLHIGWVYPDYGADGFNDGATGQDYWLTDRLNGIVEWINNNKVKYNIHFVLVLGDISESAEESEFLKAREILDKLNDPNGDGNTSDGIPYIPLIGNHDIWPQTKKNWPFQPDAPGPKEWVAFFATGDIVFNTLFWEQNTQNLEKIEELFGGSFARQYTTPHILSDTGGAAILQNYKFIYNDVKFIASDFVTREELDVGAARIYSETMDWLQKNLQAEEPTILFCHHPFAWDTFPMVDLNFKSEEDIKKIEKVISDSQSTVLAAFAGHNHINNDYYERNDIHCISNINVVTSEAICRESTWWYPCEFSKTGNNIRIVTVGGEKVKDCKTTLFSISDKTVPIPLTQLVCKLFSPADIIITDPEGFTITKEIGGVPGMFYFEFDIDGDGKLDDAVVLGELKKGDYLITTTPEPGASPVDRYTLEFSGNNINIVFAKDVQISNMPNRAYILRVTETEIIPIIPATIDFNPHTLNLKSKGQWVTAYIELPVGHGYDVSQIDLRTLMLNGQIQAEARPTAIGDYDSDGIPDLMVKFNRSAVQKILLTGEKVKITINGKLNDGRLFEGAGFIRVISP